MDNSPESLAELGKLAYEAGKFTAASNFFQQAEEVYKRSNKKLMAAEMANNRSVALLQAGDAQSSLKACKDTHLIFADAGDALREGLALGNQAAALKELGKKKESLELFKQSANRLEKAGDKKNLAVVHKTIASIEMESGDNLGAMSSMLDALRTQEKLTWQQKLMRKLFGLVSKFMPK
jgi:tetratricopeptide (TPR) repeat protein